MNNRFLKISINGTNIPRDIKSLVCHQKVFSINLNHGPSGQAKLVKPVGPSGKEAYVEARYSYWGPIIAFAFSILLNVSVSWVCIFRFHRCMWRCHKNLDFDNILNNHTYNWIVLTQWNKKPGAERFEDIFDTLTIYRGVTDLSCLAIEGEVDLVRMHERAPSGREFHKN